MSNLVAIVYPDINEAEDVLKKVREMEQEQLLDLEDAVYVTRDQDGKVKLHQTKGSTGEGAVGGAFWGLLIGLLFFAPFLGMALGAGTGALAGSMNDMGIDDKFIKRLGNEMTPGTSAIFMLVRRATVDKVVPEMSKYGGTVMSSSLSKEKEQQLQNALNQGKTGTAGQAYASEVSKND